MRLNRIPAAIALSFLFGLTGDALFAQTSAAVVTVHADRPAKAISPDLFGIFFEDLNYAADGGLYPERVQNGSFEYTPQDNAKWNPLTSWELVQRGDAHATVAVESAAPLNSINPHYAVLTVERSGSGAGLVNAGFDGIVVKAGEEYRVSLFDRAVAGNPGPIIIRLESTAGTSLGEVTLPLPTGDWTKHSATLRPSTDDADARLVVLASAPGSVALDMISLFPTKTFHDRPNGLRPDLAQVIADLHPRFVRFPGGCLAHGDGLGNMYRWKNTIGPLEQRKQQPNIWRYHQSVGLGYFEYFQFCEDIGAKPLPVLAAGVCCQNSYHKHGTGQEGIPMSEMPAYVQEVLDLVEYANGPDTSTWGAKRATAGHPAPFNLEYLGVGNEDAITPVFKERFKMIFDAVKAKYPNVTVVGTVGPAPSGRDYDAGWKIADEFHVDMVDEHYYREPDWFLSNIERYDAYDRAKSKVYVGEYAAHDVKRLNTLRSALAEAAYMTSLERNGDVVHLSSYAPLLAKQGHTQWRPDLIYFTNTAINPSINYYVQQLFMTNEGDAYLADDVGKSAEEQAGKPIDFAFSSVRDSRTGDIILKFVNTASESKPLHVELSGVENVVPEATTTVLSGDPMAVNDFQGPSRLEPKTSTITVANAFEYAAPPSSLTVIRIKSH